MSHFGEAPPPLYASEQVSQSNEDLMALTSARSPMNSPRNNNMMANKLLKPKLPIKVKREHIIQNGVVRE